MDRALSLVAMAINSPMQKTMAERVPRGLIFL
jgi:hypothetical protein